MKAKPKKTSDLPDFTKGRRWDHLKLLKCIDSAGSINAAAKVMGMSYKAAWQAVEAMNNMSEQTLVARQTGGQNGGKSLAAIVTSDSLSKMGLKEGTPVCALIRSSHIILAVRS